MGFIEINAINEVKQLIQMFETIESPKDFLMSCHSSLGKLLLRWQSNSQDQYGYGSSTIRNIKRALELE